MKHKTYHHWKVNIYAKKVEDKEKLRQEVKDATEEYLKHNTITHLHATPTVEPVSVKVKTLREISDTEEFAYLEEEYENKFY